MSTLKTDAITAVTADADLSLDGLGTGGVSIASTLKMTKGGDIASASPLVIDVDGNYFDVTGTTNFAAMTVEAGNFFMLQFDGALTITHGSGIELPGAANLTTAAGDRLICYATAANTVEVMSVETEAAASGGGAGSANLLSEVATTSGTTASFTITAGVKAFDLLFEDVSLDGTERLMVLFSDAGGYETSGYLTGTARIKGTSATSTWSDTNQGFVTNQNVAADIANGFMSFRLKDSATNMWVCSWSMQSKTQDGAQFGGGRKALSAALTAVRVTSTGTPDDFDGGSVALIEIG